MPSATPTIQTGSPPKVSVITPVYNGERYLAEAAQSVLDQDYPNIEFVLIDNCSTDATPGIVQALAEQHEWVRTVRNETLVNVIDNHNIAFAEIADDSVYCKVLHADDSLRPDCLSKMVALAEQHPRAGIIGAFSRWGERVFHEDTPTNQPLFCGRDLARRALLGEFYPFLSPSTLMIRSEVVRQRQPFYEGDRLHADLEACYEVLKCWDFAFVPEPLTTIRAHEDSVSSAEAEPLNEFLAARLEMIHRHGPEFLSQEERAVRFDKVLNAYYRFLAEAALRRPGADFWALHEATLERCGSPLERGRLNSVFLRMLVRRPGESFSTFKNHWSRRERN